MCMFCTAIPAAATAGIALNAKQKRVKKNALEIGATPKKELPVMPLTALAIGTIVVASVTTHTLLYK